MKTILPKMLMIFILLLGTTPLTAGALEKMDNETMAQVSVQIFQPLDAFKTSLLNEEAEEFVPLGESTAVDVRRRQNRFMDLQDRLAKMELTARPPEMIPVVDPERLLADLRRQLTLLNQGQAPDESLFPFPEGARRLVTGQIPAENQ